MKNISKKIKKVLQKLKSNFMKLIKQIKKNLKIEEQTFNVLELTLLVIIAFIFGILISESFIYREVKVETKETKENISELEKTYNSIINEYYEDIDKEGLTNAAIKGMMNYLKDGYSVYFDENSSESFLEQTDGEYYGIGLEMTLGEDYPYVSQIFDDTPAKEAGIELQDVIIKVDGKDVKGKSLNEISSLIKGESNNGKESVVTVLRGEEELDKKLTTKKISLPSVSSKVFTKNNKKIGYIYISIFALNTDEQFKKSLNELEKQKIESLIIDVRDNSGGHLSTVTNILNLFFNKDEILYQIDRKGTINKTYGSGNSERKYKVAVLANDASASGSEILASAFKETKKSELIGTKTFGKGSVQKLLDLNTGGMIKITSEKWLTPNGNTIHEVGVSPTIEVKLSDEYKENPTEENDNQLQKALELLSK